MARVTSEQSETKHVISLASIQVDVATNLGAAAPFISTGVQALDQWLVGGIRPGSLVVLTGEPGVGKSSLALHIAYMAARARAAAVLARVGLDANEVVARLAVRAYRRERPDSMVDYGTIYSGALRSDPIAYRELAAAVETVSKKVGPYLNFYVPDETATISALWQSLSPMLARHERVVLVVDDLEGFAPTVEGGASLEARVNGVIYDLKRIAEQGCAVVATGLARHRDILSPPATLLLELQKIDSHDLAHEQLDLSLQVWKNAIGPIGRAELAFLAGSVAFIESDALGEL